ncbi:hypothetical protein [Gemmatimonas sp.]|uniref:hypothetical protein n=1 Tax=Gemmatimonas sp. TaxID=1962908 RepID=UPI0037C1A692
MPVFDSASGPQKLTRAELYEKAWSEPMATLGPKLGLSDTGLRKICDKYHLPTPPRGYWDKVAVGQRIKRPPLPKLPASMRGSEETVIVFHQPPRPAPKELVAQQAEDDYPAGVRRRFEADPENRIVVPAILEQPHALVASSVLLLRKAKVDEDLRLRTRGLKCVALKVSLSAVDRALRLYDALFKALEARGHRVTLVTNDNETSTVVHVDGEQVGIEIQEHVTRTEVPPLKPQTGWYSKKYVWEATGRLTFVLTESYLSVRGKWSDGARQNLDEMLNDIVFGLGDAADAIKSRREAFERAERERQAAEAKRREAEDRARRARGKARALHQEVRSLQQSLAVREYVAAMRSAADAANLPPEHELRAWLEWAEEYADRLDPTKDLRVPDDPDPHAEYRTAWNSPSPEPERSSWWQRPWYNR